MYPLLASGAFGNTVPQYFTRSDWLFSTDSAKYEYWGIRSMVPGGPCYLNLPWLDTLHTAIDMENAGIALNISPMVDQVATVSAWMEIWESAAGLTVYTVEYPERGTSWRKDMPSKGKQYTGCIASLLLRKHLNSNSYGDVRDLLDQYPNHVVELSALENCLGTVPHRNHIIWEVRDY